jgi:TPR repeat protein
MSTLSGRPANPVDPSGYASRDPTERQPGGQHDAERHGVEDNGDESLSPYAPKHARRRTALDSDLAAGSDATPLAPAGVPESEWPYTDAQDDSHRSPPTAFEDNVAHDDVGADAYLGATPSLQPGADEQPVAAHREAAVRPDAARMDHDLERLESSLRWLQRQEAVTRLPRGPNLPPGPGLTPLESGSRRYGGGELRSPLSLEPERMVPPPALTAGTSTLRWSVYIFLASAVMAGTTYYFTAGSFSPPSEPAARQQLASSASVPAGMQQAALVRQEPVAKDLAVKQDLAPKQDFAAKQDLADKQASAGKPEPAARPDVRPTVARDDDPEVLREIAVQSIKSAKTARMTANATGNKATDKVSEGEIVAMLRPEAEPAKPPPPSAPIRTLDPAEVALLVKQGEQFVAIGDLVTARTVFQRAAEAGDAYAAMALGATYDPNVLAKLGVVGMGADVDKARTWYQRAETLGSQEATKRLSVLANR